MVAAADLCSGHQTGSLHPQGKKQHLFSVTHSHSLLANSTDREQGCAEGSHPVGHCLIAWWEPGWGCRQLLPSEELPTNSHICLPGWGCKFCHEIQMTFSKCVFSLSIKSVTANLCWVVGSCWSPAITVINMINCSYKTQFHSGC